MKNKITGTMGKPKQITGSAGKFKKITGTLPCNAGMSGGKKGKGKKGY